MAGWTASSIFMTPNMINILKGDAPKGPLTPEQKLQLSGGVTRQALSKAVVPASTGNTGAAPPVTNVVPQSTSGGNSATATPAPTSTPASNLPPFLQGGQNQSANPTQDLMSLLSDLIGGKQQQDPNLIKAQTVLAQQQAMEVARRNEAARNQESSQAAMGYLQRQMKDAAKYQTGSVGQILMDKYADRAKVLQRDGQLNWLNMPASSFSTPRRSGWTGPAMPGTWGL